MPLVKSASKEAFRKNVKAEIAAGRGIAAGKPEKQAVAIAYSTQRSASSTQRASNTAKSAPKGKK